MPSEFRDQKTLGQWIEQDYFQRPRRLRRWRNPVTGVVLLLCLAGVVAAFFLPRSARLVQAAPVSPAHATFNHDCGRCHTEAFQTARKVFDWSARERVVQDQACIQCHDGPPHNAVQTEAVRCATCHHEHRGHATLARVDDGHCTGCHADLAAHRKGGDDGLSYGNVHAFNDDHPEFRLIRDKRADPGQLHFNHKKHLDLPNRSETFKVIAGPIAKIKEKGCISCHEPDRAGRYMQPINYEKHCAECHPLSVQLPKIDGADREPLTSAVKEFNARAAPHKEPLVVRAVLRERLLAFVQRFPVTAGGAPDRLVTPKVLWPGLAGARSPTEAEWTWTKKNLVPLEKHLFPNEELTRNETAFFRAAGGCRYCHVETNRDPGGAELSGLPVYAKTNVRNRWLLHARFSHQRHRMLDCGQCHEKVRESSDTRDVLMPRIEMCQKCHNPQVGVRSDCAECHGYHHREGKPERHKGWTIEECLNGRR